MIIIKRTIEYNTNINYNNQSSVTIICIIFNSGDSKATFATLNEEGCLFH